MLPKLFLLFAMMVISIRIINNIHSTLFRRELCNDGFYDGGVTLKPLISNQIKRKINKRSIDTNEKINSNYASYGAYKKMKALS